MTDTVSSSEDVNTSSVTDEIFTSSHQDQQTNNEPLSFLPPLPHIRSFSPSPVSPLSDEAYLQAAAVFQQLRTEKTVEGQLLQYGKKTDSSQPENKDKTTQRRAFQLAFSTLKCVEMSAAASVQRISPNLEVCVAESDQDLLEDIITDSCFHTSQHISRDLLPLAMVMLCDFQERGFLLRERLSKEAEEPLQEVRDLESSLHRCKTKLAASLARFRVKLSLQSVSCFLSDPVRTKQHRAKRLPLYVWVNTVKTSVDEVCEVLRGAGLREVKNISDLSESTFCRDPLCPDTLVFSRQLHALLQHRLTVARVLNTQDRSVCVAVSVLRPLLFENGDVLVVGSFSALTVAHVAVAAAARSGRVLVCAADHTTSQMEETQELLTQMDLRNVRVLSEAFFGLDEWHAAVQRLKVIIVLPQCSSSALNDPVPIIHSEHGDWDLLPELSNGSVSKSKIHSMAAQQARLLAHSLSFPKVQTVVYCTRSVYPEENEQLVKRVLEKTHTHPKLLPFRVNGPIFPDDSQSGDSMADNRLFRLEPSQLSNGCFAARLSRQADPTKVETVQDVLARAAAKGLLGGIIPEQPKTVKKGKGRKNRAASAGSKPSSASGQERQNGEDPVQASENEKKGGCGEEEKDDKNEGGKKKRGLKGSKRKVKRRPKQTNRTTGVSKLHKKKPTKRKFKRRLTKTKPRRIPRLTLTLISSAKPSNKLSPITALAHKLSDNTSMKPQQAVISPRPAARPAPQAASRPAQRQNTEPARAEKTLKEAAKPESPFKARAPAVRPKTEAAMQDKPADFVLPPITFPPPSSVSSRSGSSRSQRPNRTSNSHPTQTSASSSSSISLPGL